jgi:hypothetical protein
MSNEFIGSLVAMYQQHPEITKGLESLGVNIASDPLRDAIGLLGADALKMKRAENIARMWSKTQRRLIDDGVLEPKEASLSVSLPILEASADESREEILDLWVSLLAAAMDPRRASNVRTSFVDIIKRMDPTDALVFRELPVVAAMGALLPTMRAFLSSRFGKREDDIEVSFFNLLELGLAFGGNDQIKIQTLNKIWLSAKGKELCRVLNI